MSSFERGDLVSMFTFVLEVALNDLDEPDPLLLDQAYVCVGARRPPEAP